MNYSLSTAHFRFRTSAILHSGPPSLNILYRALIPHIRNLDPALPEPAPYILYRELRIPHSVTRMVRDFIQIWKIV
jgi:hypothetical protein